MIYLMRIYMDVGFDKMELFIKRKEEDQMSLKQLAIGAGSIYAIYLTSNLILERM